MEELQWDVVDAVCCIWTPQETPEEDTVKSCKVHNDPRDGGIAKGQRAFPETGSVQGACCLLN